MASSSVASHSPLPLLTPGAAAVAVVLRRLRRSSTSRSPGARCFPPNNWWNVDISARAGRRAFGSAHRLDQRTDGDEHDRASGGCIRTSDLRLRHSPTSSLSGDQPRVPLTFVRLRRRERRGAPGLPGYPIPDEAQTQAQLHRGGRGRRRARPAIGTCSLIDRDRWLLYRVVRHAVERDRARWEAGLGSDLQPEHQRSTARGLDVGRRRRARDLSRARSGTTKSFGAAEITHAFRVTTRGRNGYVWPASHAAGSNASAPPMGARLRLKASTRHLGVHRRKCSGSSAR